MERDSSWVLKFRTQQGIHSVDDISLASSMSSYFIQDPHTLLPLFHLCTHLSLPDQRSLWLLTKDDNYSSKSAYDHIIHPGVQQRHPNIPWKLHIYQVKWNCSSGCYHKTNFSRIGISEKRIGCQGQVRAMLHTVRGRHWPPIFFTMSIRTEDLKSHSTSNNFGTYYLLSANPHYEQSTIIRFQVTTTDGEDMLEYLKGTQSTYLSR
jgi:hypothetical protein